jgi:hypothetical protein
MADALKKGIGTKFLLPIIATYTAAAAISGIDRVTALSSVLQHVGAAGVSGLVLMVLQELLPRPAKEVLIFWRLRDRPPGFRAFSVVAKRDGRIDETDLAILLPASPMSPREENSLWYRWLKEVEADPGIADNHYRFLALRDSAVLLFLLCLVTPALAFLPTGGIAHVALLEASCLAAYVLVAVSASNAAGRLVGNVIARKVATT